MDSVYQRLNHLNVKFELIKLTNQKVLGANQISEEKIGELFAYCPTFGGTEKVVNGVIVYEDTAQITTHFRPDIQSDCRLKRIDNNAMYEIITEPENYKMENIALVFKIRRLKGKFNG